MKVLILIFLILLSFKGYTYPEFIGYNYSACITCHYSSQGGGALNDYGRALWSAEIAGRFATGGASEEELGESSGFLGKTKLPDWFRPGFKLRQLWFQSNPGSQEAVSGDILMQAEANLAVSLDSSYRYMLVGSYGYAPTPRRLQGQAQDVENWISRQHYFRWQALDKLFVFVGMMDKAFGLRLVDHTAYSRSLTDNGQNDQTHGVMAQWLGSDFEVALHAFAGNLFQESGLRQTGVSSQMEYGVAENWKLGFSVLNSSSQYVKKRNYAIHSRAGYGHGSSILAEFGLTETQSSSRSNSGYYVYSQLMQKLTRGVHLFFTGQAFKPSLTGAEPDTIKTGMGLLIFPRSRVEFRLEGQNTRQFASTDFVDDDVWAVLGQIHLAL